MTDLELKKLKDDLWHSADMLRASAHLAANKYGQPILGLIFLRYADVLYKQHKNEIEEEYNKLKGTRRERSIEEIAKENSLRGLFAKEILEEIKKENYNNEIIENALEIGMEILE